MTRPESKPYARRGVFLGLIAGKRKYVAGVVLTSLGTLLYCTFPATARKEAFEHPYRRQLNSRKKEIRLIEGDATSRHSGSNILHCRTRLASLDDWITPRYETVSYCWGDLHKTSDIVLNGATHRVPESAEKIMKGLRHPNTTRTLWIDAVSINQDDRDERGDQVDLMHEIFRHAWRNLVWLGEDHDNQATTAFQSVTAIVNDVRKRTRDFRNFNECLSHQGSSSDPRRNPPHVDVYTLRTLYSQPWFSRVWVLQEAALAKSSICHWGKQEAPLLDVLRAAVWLKQGKLEYHVEMQTNSELDNACRMWAYADDEYGTYGTRSQNQILLTDLLGLSKHLEVSDCRDRVYGLLGLVKSRPGWDWNGNAHQQNLDLQQPLPRPLRADYWKGNNEVFRDITRVIIQRGEALNFLKHVRPYDYSSENHRPEDYYPGDNPQDYHGISWVPFWKHPWNKERDTFELPAA